MKTRKSAKAPESSMLTLRVASRIIERADALVPKMYEDERFTSATRADVLREALLRGLKSMEREA